VAQATYVSFLTSSVDVGENKNAHRICRTPDVANALPSCFSVTVLPTKIIQLIFGNYVDFEGVNLQQICVKFFTIYYHINNIMWFTSLMTIQLSTTTFSIYFP